jgi:hypothetical protein
MPYDMNEPVPSTPARQRKVKPLTWTAGALLIVGLVAGTVLSVVPAGMVNGAVPVATTAAEPEPSATPTPSKKPKATKKTGAPEPTLRYTSCNDVWAGGQGPFKESEPGLHEAAGSGRRRHRLEPLSDGVDLCSRLLHK